MSTGDLGKLDDVTEVTGSSGCGLHGPQQCLLYSSGPVPGLLTPYDSALHTDPGHSLHVSFCPWTPAGGSMLISAVCCFFLFFGNSESAMIGWQCLFCGTSIAAWNALDVITVELYPTNQRATAFGILNGLCKFGAILGNTIFASFVGITKVVPILLAAASLVGGGLIALRLPETREQVLM
nr:synaptic vesicle glycoprotein 2B-like [Microcebus murinus]